MADKEMVSVPVKSAAESKINWTQIAALISSIAVAWGLDVSPEQLLSIVLGIQAAQSVITLVLRTFFVKSVTPASV